ncbi:hypothetical protein KCTC32516_00358 [Polaribacter huanghezhanensis]|uniref:hypothetical protein n=1 Tax=Polaribacter huanghezhanensis TaxID=1354726 RepID=UPI0026480F75|nr:hypothetical protein [Polaribacter huanghezhanensis]WKD85020.1 hypothetical protein KCTC32516_00358 [Polaribacter huanghezhanensis]
MRAIKTISSLTLVILLFISCSNDAPKQIVFYSKDQLKKDLPVQINNTEGDVISVNSNAIINLKSSKVFEENIDYLVDVNVETMNFKIKNFTINPFAKVSNIEVFVDEIKISENDISLNALDVFTSSFEFKISNPKILSAISSKLLQRKQVVISYYSDAISDKLFNFDLEFSLTAKGTFVD